MRKLAFEKAMAEMVEFAFSLGQRSTDKACTAKRWRSFKRPIPCGMTTPIIAYLGMALLQATLH